MISHSGQQRIGIREMTKALAKAKKATPTHFTNNGNDVQFRFTPAAVNFPALSFKSLKNSIVIDFKNPPFGDFVGFAQQLFTQDNDPSLIDKEMIPCKFLAAGNCVYDKNCHFSHDPDLQLQSSPVKELGEPASPLGSKLDTELNALTFGGYERPKCHACLKKHDMWQKCGQWHPVALSELELFHTITAIEPYENYRYVYCTNLKVAIVVHWYFKYLGMDDL